MPLHRLSAFVSGKAFRVVVESPRGSTAKLKFDPAIDAMLAWDTETFPGVVIPCRALGIVKVDQKSVRSGRRERNDRVVAMPLKAPRFDHLRKAGDLPARIRHELETFFVAVTALEGKDVRILGWGGPEAALRLIRRSAIGD